MLQLLARKGARPRPASRCAHIPLCLLGTFGIVLALLALAACGQLTNAGDTSGTTGATGTIQGTVTAGPTCPVQTVENPCPDKPVPDREVDVQTPAGAVVASTKTDANGHYSVAVPPGSYVVHVVIVQGQAGIRQNTPGNVTVAAGQTVTLNIVLDTGIR